jgi:hypothetical protein
LPSDENLSLILICCICFLNQQAQPVIKNLQQERVKKEALKSAIKRFVNASHLAGLSMVVINDYKIV